MPTPTYVPLANMTLGSVATSVTFSSIPATYRDLIVVVNGQFASNTGHGVRLNGDTGANYPQILMDNNGSTPRADKDLSSTSFYGSWSATTSGTRYSLVFQLMDYSATDKHKPALWRTGYTDNGGTSRVSAMTGRWANTSAVTSLTLNTATNAFASGFTFALYGIAS
jgi:hypothetical protein